MLIERHSYLRIQLRSYNILCYCDAKPSLGQSRLLQFGGLFPGSKWLVIIWLAFDCWRSAWCWLALRNGNLRAKPRSFNMMRKCNAQHTCMFSRKIALALLRCLLKFQKVSELWLFAIDRWRRGWCLSGSFLHSNLRAKPGSFNIMRNCDAQHTCMFSRKIALALIWCLSSRE